MDDIVITVDDAQRISELRQKKFQTKDLIQLECFLSIEVARSKKQQKYVLDMLSEDCMLECRLVNSSMNPKSKMLPDQRELLDNSGRYRRLVSKLNYLIVTRPNVAFPVSVVSQFLSAPRTSHWDIVIRIF